MKNLKDKLQGAMGGVGFVLYYLVSIALVVVPVLATDLPLWVCVIIFAVLMFTSYIGSILTVFVYAYSTYVVCTNPITPFSIVFFVALVLWVVFFFIPAIKQIIETARNSRR